MSQEEEDLVNAHRKQVEETMDIVREVCDYRVDFPPPPPPPSGCTLNILR